MKESGSPLSKSMQSLNFSAQRRFKKKKGTEGREDKRGAACCISIPPAERLSVCLWQQPRRGGHSLHPHTARLSLPLSLSISPSVCLRLSRSLRRLSPSLSVTFLTPRRSLPVTVSSPCWTISSTIFSYLSIAPSPACHLSVYLSLPTNFYFAPFLFTFVSHVSTILPV